MKTVTVDVSQVVGICRPAILQLCRLNVYMTVNTHCMFAGVSAKLSGHHFRQCQYLPIRKLQTELPKVLMHNEILQ